MNPLDILKSPVEKPIDVVSMYEKRIKEQLLVNCFTVNALNMLNDTPEAPVNAENSVADDILLFRKLQHLTNVLDIAAQEADIVLGFIKLNEILGPFRIWKLSEGISRNACSPYMNYTDAVAEIASVIASGRNTLDMSLAGTIYTAWKEAITTYDKVLRNLAMSRIDMIKEYGLPQRCYISDKNPEGIRNSSEFDLILDAASKEAFTTFIANSISGKIDKLFSPLHEMRIEQFNKLDARYADFTGKLCSTVSSELPLLADDPDDGGCPGLGGSITADIREQICGSLSQYAKKLIGFPSRYKSVYFECSEALEGIQRCIDTRTDNIARTCHKHFVKALNSATGTAALSGRKYVIKDAAIALLNKPILDPEAILFDANVDCEAVAKECIDILAISDSIAIKSFTLSGKMFKNGICSLIVNAMGHDMADSLTTSQRRRIEICSCCSRLRELTSKLFSHTLVSGRLMASRHDNLTGYDSLTCVFMYQDVIQALKDLSEGHIRSIIVDSDPCAIDDLEPESSDGLIRLDLTEFGYPTPYDAYSTSAIC